MLGRRLLVLATVLVGLAALATYVAPRESTDPAGVGSTAAPPVSPVPQEASPAPASGSSTRSQGVRTVADVRGEPLLRRVDARRRLRPIEVRVGERVRLEISNSQPGAVQVGIDGPIEAIDPDSPARFDLLYSTPARQEIRVFGPGLTKPRVIGAVDVAPAAS